MITNELSNRVEQPIDSVSDDILGREPFARRLANALIDPKTLKATGNTVGIAGPWGSGKSSILNLLDEYIGNTYKDAVIVRFDPWLVSGRNDLITEFMNTLYTSLKNKPKLGRNLEKFANALLKYGKHLAPTANLLKPGGGAIATGAFSLLENLMNRNESISALRTRVVSELRQIRVPIVVLIDELDRVEDHEVRSVAQLIRAVADFPGISYVLAYDPKRVTAALGIGDDKASREEHGRSYLEKIVHLQIPLPLAFGEELIDLLHADIREMGLVLKLPKEIQKSERYKNLVKILKLNVLETPRDVKRFAGTFYTLGGMLSNEVDWVDLMAYCALLIKAPVTVERIREDPYRFVEDAFSEKDVAGQFNHGKLSVNDRLAEIVPQAENSEGIRKLLGFLFPTFSERRIRPDNRRDPLCFRRPLLTTLRLGLIPGDYSRVAVEAFLRSSESEIVETLKKAYEDGQLDQLTARLSDLYGILEGVNHILFWSAIGRFLTKPDCDWMTSFSPMHDIIRGFASILEISSLRDENMRFVAKDVLYGMKKQGDLTLVPLWLRSHVFRYGLFGNDKRPDEGVFISAPETEGLVKDMAASCRELHLSGKLIPCRWDLQPVYSMVDCGTWDQRCQANLKAAVMDDRALDGLTLMFYGSSFTTGVETVGKIISYDFYLSRVRERLASSTIEHADASVRLALDKAEGGGW